jgi:hypothetical protein
MVVCLPLPAGNAEAATLPTRRMRNEQTPTGDEPDLLLTKLPKTRRWLT